MAYPVSVSIDPIRSTRNRMTTAFRLILAIPHLLLVGGVGASLAYGGSRSSIGGEAGVLGTVAFLLAIVSWFTIVINGRHHPGIRQFTTFYLRWRVRALAYIMLLEDRYPPFGDAPYPASCEIADPAGPRNRLTVFFRLFLAIPHFIVLFLLMFGWCLTSIVAWLLILVTGDYPPSLYDFGVGALRWLIRVEAYMLLVVDDYPPFSLI
jgi:Domain of unknown function (DUF4389)